MSNHYLQVACPIEHKALFMNANVHMDDNPYWDDVPYDSVYATANNGAYILGHWHCGANMTIVANAWVNVLIPSSSALFDGFRIQRGIHPPLTTEEIQLLRGVCIVLIAGTLETLATENSLTLDDSTTE